MKRKVFDVKWKIVRGKHRFRIKNIGEELLQDISVLVDWDNECRPEGLDIIPFLQPKESFEIPFAPPEEYEKYGYCCVTIVIRYDGQVEPHSVSSP